MWTAALDDARWDVAALEHTLSVDERRRSEALRYWPQRRRFVVGRGLLRRLLARYTGIGPRDLAFAYGGAGKPALAAAVGRSDLRFNVSHSQGVALYGLMRGRRIGVDVEVLRHLVDLREVARWCCSEREVAILEGLPPERRHEAFYCAWTRKEAFLKALGTGLSVAPNRVDVTLLPHEPAAVLAVDGDRTAATGWSLFDVALGRTRMATVAVDASDDRTALSCRPISTFHWHAVALSQAAGEVPLPCASLDDALAGCDVHAACGGIDRQAKTSRVVAVAQDRRVRLLECQRQGVATGCVVEKA